MNDDVSKMRVLIKMILIQRSPNKLSAKQLSEIINEYKWGLNSDWSSTKIGILLAKELNKRSSNFMDCIECEIASGRSLKKYYIPKENLEKA